MPAKSTAKENDLVDALRCDFTNQNYDALYDLVWDTYSKRLMAHVAHKFPGLPSTDKAIAVQKAVSGFVKKVQSKQFKIGPKLSDEDLIRSVRKWLFQAAAWRGTDLLRKYSSVNEFEVLVAEIEAADTTFHPGHEIDAREIARQFVALIPELTTIQARIASVMADHFPGEMTSLELAEAVLHKYGEIITDAQARSARQQVRKRFEIILKSFLKDPNI